LRGCFHHLLLLREFSSRLTSLPPSSLPHRSSFFELLHVSSFTRLPPRKNARLLEGALAARGGASAGATRRAAASTLFSASAHSSRLTSPLSLAYSLFLFLSLSLLLYTVPASLEMTQPSLFILFTLVASSSAFSYPIWSLQTRRTCGSGGRKCAQCTGTCASDSDCDTGISGYGSSATSIQLRCFKFDQGAFPRDGTEIPSCILTNQFLSYNKGNYCLDPNAVKVTMAMDSLTLRSSGRDPLSQSQYFLPMKMGACRGDCDSDSDCVTGAFCHNRPSGSTAGVPGCSGLGVTGHDCASLSASACGERDPHSPPSPSLSTESVVLTV